MSWLSAYRKHTPTVPQDGHERLRLIEDAESRLADVQTQDAVVRDVTIPLRARNDQNHYIQGIQAAFGLPPR